MPIFKIGDLVVTPPEPNKEFWTPAEIVTIINADTEQATLVCKSRDGDLLYLGVNEVAHYNSSDAINPAHYKHAGIETIDYMKAISTKEEYEGHLRLTALKYLSRFGKKGEKLEQAEKASWYISKLIESLGE